jgi:hypothetical protein
MADAARINALLALEIARVLSDLEARRALLVRVWGLHRDRWPLAEVAFSRWKTLRQPELDALSPDAAVAVDQFYETLESFVDYVSRTVDMPLHLNWQIRAYLARLTVTGNGAMALLGPPPNIPIPEVDADGVTVLDGLMLEEMVREEAMLETPEE